ncbi:hypothetical protein [Collinsella aerofaciens]|uniref:hypothetical protein n=2 Tax=Collinsella aerofaciens TaxID=74426 RepID=UPI00359C31D3
MGRTDDMIKVKGCNMFPAQIEEILKFVDGASSGYQVIIEAVNGRDVLELLFESELTSAERDACEREVAAVFKAKIGGTPKATAVPLGELPRSEKKTKRIFDSRY